MGYSIKTGMVTDNSPMLETILEAAQKGGEAYFPSPPEQLSSLQYYVRRILKAAELLTDECGGRFAGLSRNVTVGMDTAESRIVVRSRNPIPEGEAVLAVYSEVNTLAKAAATQGAMFADYFVPSPGYDETAFREAMTRAKWNVVSLTPDPDDPDRLFVGAERPTVPAMPKYMAAILPKREEK